MGQDSFSYFGDAECWGPSHTPSHPGLRGGAQHLPYQLPGLTPGAQGGGLQGAPKAKGASLQKPWLTRPLCPGASCRPWGGQSRRLAHMQPWVGEEEQAACLLDWGFSPAVCRQSSLRLQGTAGGRADVHQECHHPERGEAGGRLVSPREPLVRARHPERWPHTRERGLGEMGLCGPQCTPRAAPSREFGVILGSQHPAASTGGGVIMVGRSNCGSLQTTWRRWSARRPWSPRGR